MQSTRIHDSIRWQFVNAFALLLTLMLISGKQPALAQESLSQPVPRTAQNGAIHYQRAILFLTAVDPAKREVLQKPIWEIVTPYNFRGRNCQTGRAADRVAPRDSFSPGWSRPVHR